MQNMLHYNWTWQRVTVKKNYVIKNNHFILRRCEEQFIGVWVKQNANLTKKKTIKNWASKQNTEHTNNGTTQISINKIK